MNLKFYQSMPLFHKWKILYFNQIDYYKQSKEHFSIKRQDQPARSIMDYALVRRTILLNQTSLWQLDRENITKYPWFRSQTSLKKNIRHCYIWIVLAKTSKLKHASKRSTSDIHHSRDYSFGNADTFYLSNSFSVTVNNL